MAKARIAVLSLALGIAVTGWLAMVWTGLPPDPALERVEEAPRPDILLITVDTLRADHLSLFGYDRPTSPHLERWFGDGELYARAYTTEANTGPSIVTALSGLYPQNHGVRLLYQRVEPGVLLLPDYLRAAGWQTAGVVSNIVLTDEAIGFAERFDHFDDYVDERELNRDIWERRASATTDAALDWLANERDPERPHLLWVHYIDPHGPYAAPEEEAPVDFTHEVPRPIDVERMYRYQRLPGIDDGAEYIDRYDEEIAYADAEIHRLLERYHELGLLDDAIVVLTADHGETMIEHEIYFNHGYHVWEGIGRVPLAVRRPGAQAARVDVPVSLVDLTPSILTWAGFVLPEGFDGLPLHERRPEHVLSVEASGWTAQQHRAAVQGDRKWLATVEPTGEISRRWFVDLTADPGETSVAPWPHDGDGGRILEQWVDDDPDPAGRPARLSAGQALDGPKVAPGRTEEQLRALEALGYVDGE